MLLRWTTAEETSHRFPYFLPDGKHFLFYVSKHKKQNRESISARWIHKKSPFYCFRPFGGLFVRISIISTFEHSIGPGIRSEKLKLSGEAIPISENIWYEPVMWGTRGMTFQKIIFLLISKAVAEHNSCGLIATGIKKSPWVLLMNSWCAVFFS